MGVDHLVLLISQPRACRSYFEHFQSYGDARQKVANVLIFHARGVVCVLPCEHTCEKVVENVCFQCVVCYLRCVRSLEMSKFRFEVSFD